MLKIKKTIYTPQNRQKDQISQIQNELKNSIKNLHLDNKKKDKTINDHSALIKKISKTI